jgi:hypothetical protein
MSKQQPAHARRSTTSAAQPARPVSKTSTSARGAISKSLAQVSQGSAPAAKNAPGSEGASDAPAQAATPPTPLMAWANAFSRGLPYALLEYCIFLGLVEWNVVATIIAGILLMIVALAVAPSAVALLPDVVRERIAQARDTIKPYAGDFKEISRSALLLGAALLVWTTFHASNAGILSLLSIVVLLAAFFFAFRAQYVIQFP